LPLYEYTCSSCGSFEVIRRFSDPPLRKCPRCGRKVEKRISAPAIQFKGSGWYVTDYARKGHALGAEKAGEAGAEKKPADAKPPESAKKPDTGKKAAGKGKAGEGR
jgi:putative FmdB family regulatory protein